MSRNWLILVVCTLVGNQNVSAATLDTSSNSHAEGVNQTCLERCLDECPNVMYEAKTKFDDNFAAFTAELLSDRSLSNNVPITFDDLLFADYRAT